MPFKIESDYIANKIIQELNEYNIRQATRIDDHDRAINKINVEYNSYIAKQVEVNKGIVRLEKSLTIFSENVNDRLDKVTAMITPEKNIKDMITNSILEYQNAELREASQHINLHTPRGGVESVSIDEPKKPFYKKPTITFSIAGGGAFLAFLVDAIVRYFKSTGRG